MKYQIKSKDVIGEGYNKIHEIPILTPQANLGFEILLQNNGQS
jgi:hypothetical protein